MNTLKELNDARMKKQAQLRIAMHQADNHPDADLVCYAADAYMESVHVLVEGLKETVRRMKKGDLL